MADTAPAQIELAVDGWAQVDVVPWTNGDSDQLDPDTQAPLNQTGVVVRRARVRVDGRRGDGFGAIELDGNTVGGSHLRLLAAELGWRRSLAPDLTVELAAGLFKIPFGAEVPRSERDRDLAEVSTASRALFPGNYDGGVRGRLAWRYLHLTIAAMNGAPAGDVQWRGVDPSASVDLVGRIGAVASGCGWSVDTGVSMLVGHGLHAGAPPTKDELVWVDGNENGLVESTELQVIDGDPGTPAVGFDRRAVGVDVTVRWWARGLGWGRADAEAVVATDLDRGVLPADPIAAARSLRELGFQVGAVQQLRPWLLIGARYDRYHGDRDAAQALGTEVVRVDPTWSTLSALASVRVDAVRLSLQVDRQRNPLGIADDGRPTTRADDRVLVRAQWSR